MSSCFRPCVVLGMAAFCDCAASLRLTHMNLRAMSMLQFMPREQSQDNLRFGKCKRAVTGLYDDVCALEWCIMWELWCIAQFFLTSCIYDTKVTGAGLVRSWRLASIKFYWEPTQVREITTELQSKIAICLDVGWLGTLDVQCCNFYHLPSVFSSNFNHPWQYFIA